MAEQTTTQSGIPGSAPARMPSMPCLKITVTGVDASGTEKQVIPPITIKIPSELSLRIATMHVMEFVMKEFKAHRVQGRAQGDRVEVMPRFYNGQKIEFYNTGETGTILLDEEDRHVKYPVIIVELDGPAENRFRVIDTMALDFEFVKLPN